MTVSKEELHMFRAGKKRGMDKMLGVQILSMIPSAVISAFFCKDVAAAISVFAIFVITTCFAYAFIFGQQENEE